MNSNRPGLFIVFDGINGSGKTTQLTIAAARLRDMGHDVLVTKNPWTSTWGAALRGLAAEGKRLSPAQELEYFLLDRQEWVRKVLKPAIDTGRTVLCDRYYYSTVAYQSAKGYDARTLLDVQQALFPLPDLAIYPKMPVELAQKRLASRGDLPDAFDKADVDVRIKHAFDRIDCPRWRAVNGTGRESSVACEVWDHIQLVLYRRQLASVEVPGA